MYSLLPRGGLHVLPKHLLLHSGMLECPNKDVLLMCGIGMCFPSQEVLLSPGMLECHSQDGLLMRESLAGDT